jgi:hypothetical protein
VPPLALGQACGRFYRRLARAPGRLGRPGTVLPGSAPDLARLIFFSEKLFNPFSSGLQLVKSTKNRVCVHLT